MDPRLKATFEKLKQIRSRTDLVLKPTPLLRSTFTDFDGTEKPFRLRYYQVQGVLHLVAMSRFVLGDETGTGKCVSGDTLIRTNRGLVPIRGLQPTTMEPETFAPVEDLSVEVDGRWCEVRRFYVGGSQPAIRLRTRFGYEVEGSLNHPVMIRREGTEQWVRLVDLKSGDAVALDRTVIEGAREEPYLPDPGKGRTQALRKVLPTHMSPELARLAGYLFARGKHLGKARCGIALDEAKHPEAFADIGSLIGEVLQCETGTCQNEHYFSSGHYLRFVESIGVGPCLLKDKRLPWSILQASQTSIREFLRAYLEVECNVGHGGCETEGSVQRGELEILLESEVLSRQLQVLLLGFGILTNRYQRQYPGYVEPHWRLVIQGIDACFFARRIGFVSRTKNHLLEPILEKYRNEEHREVERWHFDPIVKLNVVESEVFDLEVDDPSHMFVGNGIVCHNTIQCIGSLCHIWAKEPDRKVVILTTKSLVTQWAKEFEKFCTPDCINVIPTAGPAAKRQKAYRAYEDSTGPTVLILGYATARRDFKFLQRWSGHILITDEASAYKNPGTQTYQVVRHLGSPERASRHWAITATLIKNNLIEGYSIYSLLVPGLFPSSKNLFMKDYCLTRLQAIAGSRRQIPVIIGYRPEHVTSFREKIEPFFLARAKEDVASELPLLTVREHKVGMLPAQDLKYREAVSGLLEIDRTGEEKETTKLTALIYCQQIVDHLELIECEGGSAKMAELFNLLGEGDLMDAKVIVYSRFRKMIDVLEREAASKRIKSVRITGKEDEEQRTAAMSGFQDPSSDVRICWITSAGAEGINLQAAKALIFYDSPWSAGDYLQILGRMIRIGSVHDRCFAIHLVARSTIDVHVMAVLRKKMQLVEQVIGQRLKGEGEDRLTSESGLDELFAAMAADARSAA